MSKIRVMLSFNIIMGGDKLQVWQWWVSHCQYGSPPSTHHQHKRPISLDARIHPSVLQDHRILHHMVEPCCLCSKIDMMKPGFMEAAIYIAPEGENSGQHITTGMKDECGYVVPRIDLCTGLALIHLDSSIFGEVLQQEKACRSQCPSRLVRLK